MLIDILLKVIKPTVSINDIDSHVCTTIWRIEKDIFSFFSLNTIFCIALLLFLRVKVWYCEMDLSQKLLNADEDLHIPTVILFLTIVLDRI